jgi:hypothetical protein
MVTAALLIALAGCRPRRAAEAPPVTPSVAPEADPAGAATAGAPDAAVAVAPLRPPAADRAKGTLCGAAGTGSRFAVRGVDAADVLNVRAAPDPASAIVGQLPPDATGVLGTGERRKRAGAAWRKIACGALQGWVNETFLAPEGRAARPAAKRVSRRR